MRILLILLAISNMALAETITGTQVSGQIGLSGLLQKLFISKSLPVGDLTSSYGYEVLNYKNINSSKKKALYCQGGVSYATVPNLIGFSFGGSFAHIRTFGNCSRPKDYEGGFLKMGLNYSGSKGTKSLAVGVDVNLGFDLSFFNDMLVRTYTIKLDDKQPDFGERIRGVHKHLAQYIARKKLSKGTSLLPVKLMSYPLLAFTKKPHQSVIPMNYDEMEYLKGQEKKKIDLTIKQSFQDFSYDIKRDMDFYECNDLDDYNMCIYRAADAMKYIEIVTASLTGCNALSFHASPTTNLSLNIFKKLKFALVFGYYHYHLEKQVESSSSTRTLANKYFWGHNFNKRSNSCREAGNTAAADLGTFLGLSLQ